MKNRVSDIGVKNPDGTSGVWTDNKVFRNLPYMIQTAEGEPINSFYLYKTAGIFQNDAEVAAWNKEHGYKDGSGKWIPMQDGAQPGDLRFVDKNGDGMLTDDDRFYMGNAMPKTTYALTLGMTWKKLSISAMFQGVGGAQALYVGKSMLLSDVEGSFNRSAEILDAWSPNNTGSSIPRLSKLDTNKNFSRPSDFFLEDASYLRFRI